MSSRRTPYPCRKPLPLLIAAGLLACSTLAIKAIMQPAAMASGQGGQIQAGKVDLIMGNLPPTDSEAYKRIRSAAGKATGYVLELTRCEVWVVDADRVEAIRKAAEGRDVSIKPLNEFWNHLFNPAPDQTAVSSKHSEMVAMAKQSPATASVGLLQAPDPRMVEYALIKDAKGSATATPATIVLPLDDKTSVNVTRTNVTILKDKAVWRGIVKETGESVTLMWWPSGRTTGTISYRGMVYTVKNVGGSAHAVIGTKPDMLPDEHAPARPMRRDDPAARDDLLARTGDGSMMRPRRGAEPAIPKVRPRPTVVEIENAQDAPNIARPAITMKKAQIRQSAGQKGALAKPVEITVMVAYTRKAAAHYSDIKNDLIELAVEEANQTFRNSGIGHISLRLVHTHQTDYDETGSIHFDHVWRMADRGDGHMEEIPRIRNEKKADVVVLIVDDNSGCGLATRVAADAEEAYAVAHHECAATTYTLAHEVGHIIGARHDRLLDQSTGPFPYGHGHVNGMKWRTMMSYKAGCNGCPRMPVWSNPFVRINGEPAGNAMSDNARVLQEQAERVARFR